MCVYVQQDYMFDRIGLCTIMYIVKEIYKTSKSNLPNVGMAKWRHWLTKYANNESTFHNIATFHTTIPT